MKIFNPTIIILIMVMVKSGQQDNNQIIEEGIYTGKFKVVYPSGTRTGRTTLELENSKYTCNGNENRIPAGGSGTYSVGKGKITFQDENIWTADFDWNLILKGEYNYLCTGKKLKLWTEKNNGGHYEYSLTKR